MEKKNILIVGANGQLGNEMRCISGCSDNNYHYADIAPADGAGTIVLDAADSEAVEKVMSEYGINVVVNCAAYTNVDGAEDDEAAADKLNHLVPATLAAAVLKHDAVLIHVSTDYVFGGDAHIPYRETDPTGPKSVYGRTKLEGEKAVVSSRARYIIFRTAWLYSTYGRNFVKTMQKLTAEKDTLDVVFDQIGTPTCAADLAAVIYDIIENGKTDRTGIYHYSNEGVCSWYDFACAVRDLSGNICDIRPCRSDEYPAKACRPAYSVLDKTKFKETFGIEIPHWYEALSACIATMG